MTYFFFVLGFVLLIKGADWLVKGASTLAKLFHVSDMVIGLSIVSFGTSLPELLVSLLSSTTGRADLAIGNVLGSNIANILLILGVSASIRSLPIHTATVMSEIPYSLIAALLLGFLANAGLFADRSLLSISRVDGGILVVFLVLFLAYIWNISQTTPGESFPPAPHAYSLGKTIAAVVAGIGGLLVGGQWVVEGAVQFAVRFGLSESFVGLTIVAIGTSLPELVTSAVAAYRQNTDIAIGNVIGSNIFNIVGILGISALITPLPFDVINNTDILMVIFSSVLIFLSLVVGKKAVIDRREGVIFIALYIMYLVYLVQRG